MLKFGMCPSHTESENLQLRRSLFVKRCRLCLVKV